jgi:hypothetical protein
MEAIDLGDSPKPERAASRNNALQIDKLVSEAQKSQPITTAAKPIITPKPRLANHRISFSFKHKRLCEKWLDNLFMVLYNDLRLYTALKQEYQQYW